MAAAVLTGRIILCEAEKRAISPCEFSDFKEFIEEFIISYNGFSKPLEPFLQEQISEFLSDWPSRVRNLFKDKYKWKWDKFLAGNHPKYFDSEIRFVTRPPTPPPSPKRPKPSGSFIILVRSRKGSFLKFLRYQKMSGVF